MKNKTESSDTQNCSQHKKEVAGISDMKELAEIIGDLHYESLYNLLAWLGMKLCDDGFKDTSEHRQILGTALKKASDSVNEASDHIHEAWQISKPFMETNKKEKL